jgi:hypothetical protein
MLTSPVRLRPEKGCAGDAQEKLETTDPTSYQRGRPTSTNPQLSKNNSRKKGINWSRVTDGCLTPRQTGRLTVDSNITLSLTLTHQSTIRQNWPKTRRPWLKFLPSLLQSNLMLVLISSNNYSGRAVPGTKGLGLNPTRCINICLSLF